MELYYHYPNRSIKRYSNKKKRMPRKMTVAAIVDGNNIRFGLAKCNKKAGDHFVKSQGRTLALIKATTAPVEVIPEDRREKLGRYFHEKAHELVVQSFSDKEEIVS